MEVRVQFQDRQGQTDGSIHIVLLFGPLCGVNSSTGPSGAIIGFILDTEAATLVLRYRVHLLFFILLPVRVLRTGPSRGQLAGLSGRNQGRSRRPQVRLPMIMHRLLLIQQLLQLVWPPCGAAEQQGLVELLLQLVRHRRRCHHTGHRRIQIRRHGRHLMLLSDGRRMSQLRVLSHGIEVAAKFQIIVLCGCSSLKKLLISTNRFLGFVMLRGGRSLCSDPLELPIIPGQKLRLLLLLGSF